jgi:hypothetical protein
MMLRLDITPTAGASYALEQHAPTLRIGRDPRCEVVLQGNSCEVVSWHHARIDLTPRGAFLRDLRSSNGTFVRDRRVVGRVRLTLGDYIQIGHTGPVLKLVALDLAESAPHGAPSDGARGPVTDESWPWLGPDRPGAPRTEPETRTLSCSNIEALAAPPDAGEARTWRLRWQPVARTLVHRCKPHKRLLLFVAAGVLLLGIVWILARMFSHVPPADEPRPSVGHIHPAAGPAILLSRTDAHQRWALVQPGDQLAAPVELMSLPGYRSRVELESGAGLELWGDLPPATDLPPEETLPPPVLESRVRLKQAAADVDLEFTLERGRVRLFSTKTGAARVRVHFQQEEWDLTLSDDQTEVVLSLFGQPEGGLPDGKDAPVRESRLCVEVLVRGHARLEGADEKGIDLSDKTMLTWAQGAPTINIEPLRRLPAWWTEAAPARGSRDDFAANLKRLHNLDQAVAAEVEAKDARRRERALFFLGALDRLDEIVQRLELPEYTPAGVEALLNGSAVDDAQLREALAKQYSPDELRILLGLLHFDGAGDIDRKEARKVLEGFRKHKKLAIQELANIHLASLPRD